MTQSMLEALAPLLGWSEARKAEEIAWCRDRHGTDMAALRAATVGPV